MVIISVLVWQVSVYLIIIAIVFAYVYFHKIAYPEYHKDSNSKEDDLHYLKLKQDVGADFIITQLFYDCDAYLNWLDRCHSVGKQVYFS